MNFWNSSGDSSTPLSSTYVVSDCSAITMKTVGDEEGRKGGRKGGRDKEGRKEGTRK